MYSKLKRTLLSAKFLPLVAACLLATPAFAQTGQKAGKEKAQRPSKPTFNLNEKPEKKSEDGLSSQTELVLKSVSERYAKLRAWSAPFAHESYSVALGTSRLSKGEFVFVRPDKFRFTLNGPAEISDFISNGKEAWYIRFPNGRKKSAQVQHFQSLQNIELDKYLILLRGISTERPEEKAKVLRDFKVESLLDSSKLSLLLTPKGSSDISEVSITFENTKPTPASAKIVDSLGGEVTIKLGEAKMLKTIDKKAFVPNYPKDSKIEEFR
ncbi:outer membrane lipoprotein carrier protein LolA [bacterium]|nr:outer membrane lipoprotein carrier protein LolA [bacterium]